MSGYMVENLEHSKCTGCGACYNACPTKAVQMEYDNEGFLFPTVSKDKCIQCGLCVDKCPELHADRIDKLFHSEGKCMAAMAEDDIRMESSSGGAFSVLADWIYSQGGLVCGAVYSENYEKVYHIVSESRDDLTKLRGSKYVQSDIGNVYAKIKKALGEHKKVLFSGCPCQVTGLYSFLGKKSDLLYTVDLICHGANSVYAYQSYIKELANGRNIKRVNFRDKSEGGWTTPVSVDYEDGSRYYAAWDKNDWYPAFLGGIINRECCYNCHYAKGERVADITLGDFWQIHKWKPEYNDWKGTSLVLINSEHGETLYSEVEKNFKLSVEASLDFARQYNGQLNRPTKMASGRKYFFKHLLKDGYHKSLWYGREWRYDVGLVGWWFSANYGSVLTYYALGKILLDMEMLPILIGVPKKDGTPWEPITERNVNFMKKYFHVSKPRKYENLNEVNKFCDGFMLGSDQLWVSPYNKLVGYTFYLDFADEKKKKIAYSTSLGYSEYDGSERDKKIVQMLLSRFDGISVREKSGVGICESQFNVEAKRELDPVFLCDIKHYDELANVSKIQIDGDYILCYVLDPTEEKRDVIRRLEKKYQMKSKIVLDMKSFDQASKKWSSEDIISVNDVGIEEFVYLIKNCSYLMTDSHHGACFAMIYNKNFVAISNPRRGKTRFDSLFELLEIKGNLLEEGSLCENIDNVKDVDYNRLNEILKKEKAASMKWLSEVIEKEKNVEETKEDLFAKYFNEALRLDVKLKKK